MVRFPSLERSFRRFGRNVGLTLGLLFLVLGPPSSCRLLAQVSDAPARQVTLVGIMATPGDPYLDPRLRGIAPRLQMMLPNHGFRLLDVKSQRMVTGETLACNLKIAGFEATTSMVQPLDVNGKVQLRVGLNQNEQMQFQTVVSTPPNQIFFCERPISGGGRILIGVGAR
jgi:hypothetical protein